MDPKKRAGGRRAARTSKSWTDDELFVAGVLVELPSLILAREADSGARLQENKIEEQDQQPGRSSGEQPMEFSIQSPPLSGAEVELPDLNTAVIDLDEESPESPTGVEQMNADYQEAWWPRDLYADYQEAWLKVSNQEEDLKVSNQEEDLNVDSQEALPRDLNVDSLSEDLNADR